MIEFFTDLLAAVTQDLEEVTANLQGLNAENSIVANAEGWFSESYLAGPQQRWAFNKLEQISQGRIHMSVS